MLIKKKGNNVAMKNKPDLVSQPPVLGWLVAASHNWSTYHSVCQASCQHFSPSDKTTIMKKTF